MQMYITFVLLLIVSPYSFAYKTSRRSMRLCHVLALHIVVLPEEALHQSVPCRFMPVLRECPGDILGTFPGFGSFAVFSPLHGAINSSNW